MNLLNFIAQFPDDESCKLKYKDKCNRYDERCFNCSVYQKRILNSNSSIR